MYTVATPTYVSEVAPPEIRGMMLAQINFMFLIGQYDYRVSDRAGLI